MMKNSFTFRLLLLTSAILLVGTLSMNAGNVYTLNSPNGKIKVEIGTDKHLSYLIIHQEDTLLAKSEIGLTLHSGFTLGENPVVVKSKKKTITENIVAPFYRFNRFTASCYELDLKLKGGFGILFRVYNEGVAYRFYTTHASEMTIKNELAEFNFSKDHAVYLPYSTNDQQPLAMAFQNIYDATTLSQAASKLAFLPVTIDYANGIKLTLLEADLENYPGMFVESQGNEHRLQGKFAPYPAKTDFYPWRQQEYVTKAEDFIARTSGPRSYPWRILAITEKDTEMPVNNLVYALASPNRIGDYSWIKTGKVAWDWWNDWNLKGVDFKAGINFDTYKYYIDFAHNHGLEYIVLDEGWYNSKEGSILKPIDNIQLPKLIEYGKSKGVDIVLWAVFNVMDENLETICKTYADMGIKGFKVDFMDRDDQTAIEMVERLAACTAKHHLILDLHGIYKPHGLNRTYPNILNYESVFGMEECRWTEAKNDMPLYDVTFPYIRMMAGQVDFTPGAMRNGTRDNWKAIYTKPISMGTRCHQAACYIVQDSPFTMLADTPTNYEADEPYTRYIASLPVVFDKTIVPQGEIGKYIVTARKKGNDWYVGGQSNWDERTLTLKFDFLADGDYEAIVLKDGINANHDAEDYKIEKYDIHQNSEMKIHLASGGGFVIKVIKK